MKNEVQRFSSESIKSRLKRVDLKESFFETVKASLEKDVFGQPEACEAVARMVTRFESGVNDPEKPAGILLFLGPTGIGKTEMGKALARYLFGDDSGANFKKIDCADYSEPHTVSRFIGAPPGYVGYGDELVIEPGFLNNRNVIIFDEIEKADPALWRMLLSVFDSATLGARIDIGNNDTEEVQLDFSKSFIILTSNVGAGRIQEEQRNKLGFLNKSTNVDLKGVAINGLTSFFSEIPEFLGRIDEFIVFNPLKKEHYEQIYWKFIGEKNDQLRVRLGVDFSTTFELADFLIKKAVADNRYGARDIRKVIKKDLIQPLADILASQPNIRGLVADLEEDKIVFYDLSPELPEIPTVLEKEDVEDERLQHLIEILGVEQKMDEKRMKECELKFAKYLYENTEKSKLFNSVLGNLAIIGGKIICDKGQEQKIARALSLVANISGLSKSFVPASSNEEVEKRMVDVLEFYLRVRDSLADII